MIEIDEIVPFYICKMAESEYEPCLVNGHPCFPDCEHVQNPMFAKNEESVKIFEAFAERFGCVVDDNGRLCVWEKEK